MTKVSILLLGASLCLNSYAQPSCCAKLPSRFAATQPTGMKWIPEGTFTMGSVTTPARPDEAPLHEVQLDGFWISETPVTNAQFKKFVEATGYVTTAEKKPDIEELKKNMPPNSPPIQEEFLIPASLVFNQPTVPVSLNNPLSWWKWEPNANWSQPNGPTSSIEGKDDHPVIHVSWYDAKAYADWAGGALPTEAQWEYAARGGNDQWPYTWGHEPVEQGKHKINIWQGQFPYSNTADDTFSTTSPVKQFAPNSYGLYDMAGNVWEWVADWYHPETYKKRKDQLTVNPIGPDKSYDPQEPYAQKRVTRGGSFLCNDSYCSGYRPSARMKTSPDTSLIHTGFRIVKNSK